MKSHHVWEHHVIGIVSTNCYIFGDPSNAIMFDPGGPEAVSLVKKFETNGIEVKHVIATHGHFDHLGWATEVQKYLEGATVYLHKEEKPVYEDYHSWMGRYGLSTPELREPDKWLKDNEILSFSGYKLQVIHTPGHSPGSASFRMLEIPLLENYHPIPSNRIDSAFVGDVLFQGSIGRTDFPYCNQEDMVQSLWKLMQLPEETKIYPGHGGLTKLSIELSSNPFLLALQKGIPIF